MVAPIASLSGLERLGQPASPTARLRSGLIELLLALFLVALVGGASIFVFGLRRMMLDVALWPRVLLGLAALALVRRLAALPGRGLATRLAGAVETLLFLASSLLLLNEAVSLFRRF
jgi:predicted anti-sigma-YlaC factor YlaD